MSQKTVDLIVKLYELSFGYQFGPCITRHIPLVEDPLWNVEEVNHYKKLTAAKTVAAGLGEQTADYLVANFGKQSDSILEGMKDFSPSEPEEALIRSELRFCFEKEMVVKSVDFLDRRTGRMCFDIGSVKRFKDIVLNDLAGYALWDENQKKSDREFLELRMKEVTSFS